MTLEDDRAGIEPESFARVRVWLSAVGPIADLISVDPHGHVGPFGDDRFVKPLEVASHDAPGILPAKDAAGAAVAGQVRIAVVCTVVSCAVVNLAFIAHPKFARDRTKEDTRVGCPRFLYQGL